jgi:hypothetical protein
MLGYDCHLSVSMPYALARSPIPCSFLSFVSFLQARQRSGTLALTPGLLGHPVRRFREAYKETNGSPKPVLSAAEGFPGYPLELMPCSSTPVVTSILALAHPGLLPSTPLTVSAFPPKTDGYPLRNFVSLVHDYTNFGAQSHGLFSCSPWLRTSVTGLTRKVHYCPVG